MISRNKKRVTVTLYDDTLQDLKNEAKHMNMSLSELIEEVACAIRSGRVMTCFDATHGIYRFYGTGEDDEDEDW